MKSGNFRVINFINLRSRISDLLGGCNCLDYCSYYFSAGVGVFGNCNYFSNLSRIIIIRESRCSYIIGISRSRILATSSGLIIFSILLFKKVLGMGLFLRKFLRFIVLIPYRRYLYFSGYSIDSIGLSYRRIF